MQGIVQLLTCGDIIGITILIIIIIIIIIYLQRVIPIERFSFECRKVIGFALSTLRDWLKKLAPIFLSNQPSETKTNRDSLAHVFPRFASATCNYFEF